MRKLYDAAAILRSKNSGPFSVTFDVLFPDRETYETMKARQVITREKISSIYHVPLEHVSPVVYFDSAMGVKVTIARRISSGSPLDTDVYGAQQHAPLMELEIDF